MYFFMVVVVKSVVFGRKFMMDSVDFVDFVLKLQSQTDFLIEGLFCLFEVLHQYVLFIL